MLGAEFLNWDDALNVSENPYLQPLSLKNVGHFWTEPYAGLWVPVTYNVWAVVAWFAERAQSAGELDPRWFHAMNLLVHVASTLVLFALLRREVRHDTAACAGALLFAVHPLIVEPVAWVTGAKDVLSVLFSLVALWAYLNGERGPQGEHGASRSNGGSRRAVNLAIATVAYLLALASKPSAVTLPLVALAWEWGAGRANWTRTAPVLGAWMALGAIVAVTTRGQQADVEWSSASLFVRPLVATDVLAFYLFKLVLPISLGPDYGRTPEAILRSEAIWYTWLLPVGVLLAATWPKDRRIWLAGLAMFVAAAAPVLGLVPFAFQRFSTVADRYVYLSLVGPAWILAHWIARRGTWWRVSLAALALAVLVVLSYLQATKWQNSGTLFRHAIRVNPRSTFARGNLASYLASRNDVAAAIELYQEAIALDPQYVEAIINLGQNYAQTGRTKEAISQFRSAVEIAPRMAKARFNLGNALAADGQYQAAATHFGEAARLRPNYMEAYANLGSALMRLGRASEAIAPYREAARLAPRSPAAHVMLGSALELAGRIEEAAQQYRRALALEPRLSEAQEGLKRLTPATQP